MVIPVRNTNNSSRMKHIATADHILVSVVIVGGALCDQQDREMDSGDQTMEVVMMKCAVRRRNLMGIS